MHNPPVVADAPLPDLLRSGEKPMKEKLLFIVGPTASGKTELALKEARERNAAILSCDSLCFYRGMDIGTAKPDLSEQAVAPHYGIDLIDPNQPYSVSLYIEYRDAVLKLLKDRRQPVIVVGGSGFYLKSYFSPVIDEVHIPGVVTKLAEAIRREEGLAGLIRLLKQHNPSGEMYEGLDLNNPRRVEKAAIRCISTEKSYSQLRAEFQDLPEPLTNYDKEVWLVSRPAEELKDRNRRRVERMLQEGLIEEVRQLIDMGFEHNPSACGAIGYREVIEFLNGDISEENLAEQIYVHTNQLMRKQRTWFRKQIPIHREVPGS